MSDFKPLVYEWDHARNRYVTPGDRVECLKERVVAADDYVTMKEELRARVAELEAHMRLGVTLREGTSDQWDWWEREADRLSGNKTAASNEAPK